VSCQIVVGGQAVQVQFPHHMEALAECGVNGWDYPLIAIPDFSPQIIVDIGANIGATALSFLKNFPAATIHCFEPARETFDYLERNTAPFPQIVRHRLGLADRAEEVRLYPGAEQCAQTSVFQTRYTRPEGEAIRLAPAAETLRHLGLTHIGILKIDTEGCEVPILRDVLQSSPGLRIDVLYLEYHSEEDRVRIDRLLTPTYWLGHAKATKVHRGTVGYVHPRLYEGREELYSYRIVTP